MAPFTGRMYNPIWPEAVTEIEDKNFILKSGYYV